jgi:sulfite reductase (NADPH) hemoprotein beta-component
VICSAIPTLSTLHAQVYEFCKGVSEHLLPRTTAYHEIWLDKKLVAGEALKDIEPIYGEFYLPRKVFVILVAKLFFSLLLTNVPVQNRSSGPANQRCRRLH